MSGFFENYRENRGEEFGKDFYQLPPTGQVEAVLRWDHEKMIEKLQVLHEQDKELMEKPAAELSVADMKVMQRSAERMLAEIERDIKDPEEPLMKVQQRSHGVRTWNSYGDTKVSSTSAEIAAVCANLTVEKPLYVRCLEVTRKAP